MTSKFMRKWERLINIIPIGSSFRKWLYGCSVEDGFRYHGKRPQFNDSVSIAFNVFIGNAGDLTIGENVHIASDVNIHSHSIHSQNTQQLNIQLKTINTHSPTVITLLTTVVVKI